MAALTQSDVEIVYGVIREVNGVDVGDGSGALVGGLRQRTAELEAGAGKMAGVVHKVEEMMKKIEAKFVQHEVAMANFGLERKNWETKMGEWAAVVQDWTNRMGEHSARLDDGLKKLREDATVESGLVRVELAKMRTELDLKVTVGEDGGGHGERPGGAFGGK